MKFVYFFCFFKTVPFKLNTSLSGVSTEIPVIVLAEIIASTSDLILTSSKCQILVANTL